MLVRPGTDSWQAYTRSVGHWSHISYVSAVREERRPPETNTSGPPARNQEQFAPAGGERPVPAYTIPLWTLAGTVGGPG